MRAASRIFRRGSDRPGLTIEVHRAWRAFLAVVAVALALAHPLVAQRTIRGTVENDEGRPVVNALFRLTGIGMVTRSDEDGRFELVAPGLPLGALEVRAVCYLPWSLDRFEDEVRIVLDRDPATCRGELRIRGEAVSARDGTPVVAGTFSPHSQAYLDVRADENGRFSMRVPSPGRYRFEISAICFDGKQVDVVVDEASVDLGRVLLEPADSILTSEGTFACRGAG